MPPISPHAKLRVRRGRSLVFSPAWDEEGASVLFDRNSGDYWVLTAPARSLVSAVANAGSLPYGAVLTVAREQPDAHDAAPVTDGDIDAILDTLMQVGILAQDDGLR